MVVECLLLVDGHTGSGVFLLVEGHPGSGVF